MSIFNTFFKLFLNKPRRCSRTHNIYLTDALPWTFCIFVSIFIILAIQCNSVLSEEHLYANEWAVEIIGDESMANKVAESHGFINLGRVFPGDNIYHFKHNRMMKRSTSAERLHHDKLSAHSNVDWAEQQVVKKRRKRDIMDVPFTPNVGPNDPLWSKTWYLLPSTTPNMKVVEAWEEGITGKDIVVTILDDGIEHDHPDLEENYDPMASYDINNNDDDPQPRTTFNNENRHGTRCAGAVSAVANNQICSIGIAFRSKIGGVRMLDGDVTDIVEAKSIGLRPQHIEIYSASWGPDDDGKTVDGPARLARKAFEDGVKLGRGGKGSIFVWASGNGGRYADNCNCDGYTNSIYTLSISSTTQRTNTPWYSEKCSSTLATTYSSGTNSEKQIVTTDLNHQCTTQHTGTSASAPIAAAVCALALEANRNLTWRDMQHIVVQTAKPGTLKADDWAVNGVNRKVSHSYGYGLLDAQAMVKTARDWVTVPPQRKCSIRVISNNASPRKFTKKLELEFPVQRCDDGSPMIEKMEHVQAQLSAKCDRRGDMSIHLVSPMGTSSMLLGKRRNDYSSAAFNDWSFMTTHVWDENPSGDWKLIVENTGTAPLQKGHLSSFVLIIYGTLESDWKSSTSSSAPLVRKPTPASLPISTSPTSTTHSSTSASSPQASKPVGVYIPNCDLPTKSGKNCLVLSTGRCVKECPASHYTLYEKVSEDSFKENENMKSATQQRKNIPDLEQQFEEKEEKDLEVDERLGMHVCRPCANPNVCHKCNGPQETDCLQCAFGAEMKENKCVTLGGPVINLEESHLRRRTIILICILSVLTFLVLFAIFSCCSRMVRKRGYVTASYKNLHNDFVDEEDFDLEIENVKSTRINGSSNGYSRTLLNAPKSIPVNTDLDKQPLVNSDVS